MLTFFYLRNKTHANGKRKTHPRNSPALKRVWLFLFLKIQILNETIRTKI